MTTHTATRWHWIADVEDERVELWDDDADATEPIAIVETTDWLGADRDPNLRLIAAAPDLLAALEALEIHHRNVECTADHGCIPLQQARTAIARARGDA